MASLQDAGHECDRFKVRLGLPCPFRKSREDLDEEEDEDERDAFDIPLALPGRAAKERSLSNITTLAVAPKELREALERMAAFKQLGGAPSIPSFPFQGRGHPEIISVLTAIALMTAFRALRSKGFGMGSNAVRIGERHVAQGLSKVVKPQGSARVAGRGGFHVNAAADLRRLLFGRRRLRDEGSAGIPGGSEK